MKPDNLSASSGAVYESCPARYKAEYIDRARMVTGDPAAIGTVAHACLERFVKEGHYKATLAYPASLIDVMKSIFDTEYYQVFSDKREYATGLKLVQSWWPRQDWNGREVLSCEKRDSFKLSTSAGDLPFVYIIDRLDRTGPDSIEVIDYKTVSRPIQPDELKHKLQARAYAVAAQIMFPDAEKIWVTFDLLRFGNTVSCCFTREENRENYLYLKALAQRIINDDHPREILNPDCQFCIRKSKCREFDKHIVAGGPFSIPDVHWAAARRFDLENVNKGIQKMIQELDAYLMAEMEEQELLHLVVPGFHVEVTADRRRSVDSGMASHIVGPAIMARYGKLKLGDIDELLKSDELTDAQKKELRDLITVNVGAPAIKIKKKP